MRIQLNPLAFAILAVTAHLATAQESTGPKLRILSSRQPNTESSSSSVVFERAGSSPQQKQTTDSPPPAINPARPGTPPVPSSAGQLRPANPKAQQHPIQTQRPVTQTAQGHAGSFQTPPPSRPNGVKPAPNLANMTPAQVAELKRTIALQRVASMNQISGPREAGVPQGQQVAVENQNLARQALADATKARSSSVKPSDQGQSQERYAPTAAAASPNSDPLASEISREGESYYFLGSLNGIPVRFRINREVFGIKIPSRIASVSRILTPEVTSSLAKMNEIISPIHSISFGAYPVKSVMAKIYIDNNEDVIDIGLDALAAFKIQDQNGRRMLVKS